MQKKGLIAAGVVVIIVFSLFIFSLNNEDTVNTLELSQVKYWAYQIQNLSSPGVVDKLAASRYDMLVLEPTRTDWSSEERDFDTKKMVSQLKNTSSHDGKYPKLVIAYLDIGEAEDYRWYWNWSRGWEAGQKKPSDWPDFILTPDPDGWEGNYPVAYWDPDWKDVMIYGKNQNSRPYGDYKSAIDEIIDDGFDGVYLDWVEGYEDPNVIQAAKEQGKDPEVEMVKFIREIRDYARSRDPDFIIIQQNAASLGPAHPELYSLIDGISQEAIWYDGTAYDDWDASDGYDVPTDPQLTPEYLDYLQQYKAQGVVVFNCEYALKKAEEAYNKSEEQGFVAYCTRRSLSALSTTFPPGY